MQLGTRWSIASAYSSFLWLHKEILFLNLIVLASAILSRSGCLGSYIANLPQKKQFSFHLNMSSWKEDEAAIYNMHRIELLLILLISICLN